MKLNSKKLMMLVMAGALSMSMSFAALAMPGDVGGTWNGYDNYEDWYFSIHGHYPPDDDNGDDDNEVGEVTDVWWKGSTAKWDFDGNCRKFEVRLYRDGDHVDTKKTSKNHYDFSDLMNEAGDYTFTVRAVYGDQRSDWSDESDEHHIRSGSSSSGSTSSGSSGGPGVSAAAGQWIQAQDGTGRYWYRHANGSYTTNNWELINGKWYFFDGSGWMETGWIHWNGNTYYCLSDGSMATGDVAIDGKAYHFNASGAFE